MFAERIHSVSAVARMPAVAVEGVGQCCAESQKAKQAGKKTKINVGAVMVIRRMTTATGALLNIYNKRTTNGRHKCPSELSANASRALR